MQGEGAACARRRAARVAATGSSSSLLVRMRGWRVSVTGCVCGWELLDHPSLPPPSQPCMHPGRLADACTLQSSTREQAAHSLELSSHAHVYCAIRDAARWCMNALAGVCRPELCVLPFDSLFTTTDADGSLVQYNCTCLDYVAIVQLRPSGRV